jgi:hypothetical protein
LTLAPDLVEKDNLDGVGAITDGGFDHGLATLGSARGDFGHFGEDSDLLAHVQITEVDLARPIDVPAGVGRYEVKDGFDTHLRKGRGALLADVTKFADCNVRESP